MQKTLVESLYVSWGVYIEAMIERKRKAISEATNSK